MNSPAKLDLNAMRDWIAQHQAEWLDQYYQFLSFPSVSADPQYKQEILDCAQWVGDFLKSLQFEVDYWQTSGHPVIFAKNMQAGPNKPTLLIYNHYDVQPVDPLDEWISPPFQPTMRDGQVYARGAQDNKGQCFYVLQALKLLLDQTKSFPLNIKLCIEGEEETGSAGLSRLLDAKKPDLQADYLAIVDSGLRDAAVPALTLGLRGIVTFDVELRASTTDLHSGLHGGIALNPIHALVNLLASLRDERGRITIPGFYEHVVDLPVEDRTAISFHFDAADYQQQTGAYPLGGEKDFSVLERAWIRPTLEINGIEGGYTGKGFKTVIPAKAHAKLSCRIVPNQRPEIIGKLVANYLRDNVPKGVEISVHVHPGQGKPVRVNLQSPIVKSFAKAFEEVFGVPCESIFSGASIPIVSDLTDASEAEVIMLGLGLDSDLIHAPNEHFGIDRLEKGMLMVARAIEILAEGTHLQ